MLLRALGLCCGCTLSLAAQVPLPLHGPDDHIPTSGENALITPAVDRYIEDLLEDYNSPGLSVAVVRRNSSYPDGWHVEFGSYGVSQVDGSPVTPDSLFAIASNSKLFLSLSVGLLIANESLAEESGSSLSWHSKAEDVFPQWALMDKDMERLVSVQDMLSHQTGLPRHDDSGRVLEGGVSEMIYNLRYLRPSAGVRETWQYNNLMYETLSNLPSIKLGEAYESYISKHFFEPLDMTSSTYSVAAAEASENFAHGFMRYMYDEVAGVDGTRMAVVPYFSRPGEEKIWAGAGGVISSARDLSVWVAMLLGNGKHPFTNETVIPEEIVEHVARGVSVSDGAPSNPEISVKVYGAGQERYTYRSHELIEHTGSNPGFNTRVQRFPNDQLGIIVLSNDEEYGTRIHELVSWRIADEVFGLPPVDWKSRLEGNSAKKLAEDVEAALPRPAVPVPPSQAVESMEGKVFYHPSYGALHPCFVGKSVARPLSSECAGVLSDPVTAQIVKSPPTRNSSQDDASSIPTLVIPFKQFFATHLMLRHFSENLFNATIFWSNHAVRQKEKYDSSDGDVIIVRTKCEVEWVHGVDGFDEGLAFKGGFWGKGSLARAPAGTGQDSAEVWFARV